MKNKIELVIDEEVQGSREFFDTPQEALFRLSQLIDYRVLNISVMKEAEQSSVKTSNYDCKIFNIFEMLKSNKRKVKKHNNQTNIAFHLSDDSNKSEKCTSSYFDKCMFIVRIGALSILIRIPNQTKNNRINLDKKIRIVVNHLTIHDIVSKSLYLKQQHQ